MPCTIRLHDISALEVADRDHGESATEAQRRFESAVDWQRLPHSLPVDTSSLLRAGRSAGAGRRSWFVDDDDDGRSLQVEASCCFDWKLLAQRSETGALRRRLLKRAVAVFVAGTSPAAANADQTCSAGHEFGDEPSVADIKAAARRNGVILQDDQPWDAAVMDAVAFAVPVRAPVTGDIAVMDVLQRCLLWLPPEQRALLAVSGVSRGWRAAAERLPQWCLVPQLRFVSKALGDMVRRVPDDNSEDDSDEAPVAPRTKNARTRTAYVAVMQQRQEAHQARFALLKTMLRCDRTAAKYALPCTGVAFAVCFLLLLCLAVAYDRVLGWDGAAFAPLMGLALAVAFVGVIGVNELSVNVFAGVTSATRRRVARGRNIGLVFGGAALMLTLPFTLTVNRVSHLGSVVTLDTIDTSSAAAVAASDVAPPAYVAVSNIEAWTVVPWHSGGLPRTGGPLARQPASVNRDVTRGSVGHLAPHNESLFRSLCDADALAAAEGPKWLARRLSTPAGIRALINDTHQCNDVFTDLSATGLGLMQPPPPLHRFVYLVPPVAQHLHRRPIAVHVPDADDAAVGFTALMRRIATGGSASTTSSGVDATASAAPAGTVEGGEVTLLRSAWSTLLSPIRDDDTASAGQQWFNASRRPVPWASRYTDSDSLTRRAVAALSLADADEAEALFNRSRGHPQPLTLYGGVLADSERAPWWLEPPDGHAGAASLWRAEGVPLVIGIADEAPAQQRAWFVTRAFIITGVGVAAIAAATAASMLPEHRLGSAALEMLAMTVLFVTVNPAWLLALAVGCKAAENNPAYCFMSDTVTGACVLAGVLFGVLHTSVFCLEACRLRGSR